MVYRDHAFSGSRRFLVVLAGNSLLAFDLTTRTFTDGRRLTAPVGEPAIWSFSKPNYRMIRLPDDRLVFLAAVEGSTRATFCEVRVSREGELSLTPFVTLTADSAPEIREVNGAVIAFLPDAVQRDGSYDLFLGRYWRTPGTTVRVIRDFIRPRTTSGGGD